MVLPRQRHKGLGKQIAFPFPMTWEVSELGDRNGYTYTSIYNAKFHLNNTGHLKAPVWLYFSLVPEFNLEALS